ncbi:hypothetical protein GCM10009104_05620 [Marinobacterium maritimum]|uniref:Uncharacterized protein n=1 Tax=Marinobacterium maritimum TaxID=500162 RepID=A0ABP3TA66_9GAMM
MIQAVFTGCLSGCSGLSLEQSQSKCCRDVKHLITDCNAAAWSVPAKAENTQWQVLQWEIGMTVC